MGTPENQFPPIPRRDRGGNFRALAAATIMAGVGIRVAMCTNALELKSTIEATEATPSSETSPELAPPPLLYNAPTQAPAASSSAAFAAPAPAPQSPPEFLDWPSFSELSPVAQHLAQKYYQACTELNEGNYKKIDANKAPLPVRIIDLQSALTTQLMSEEAPQKTIKAWTDACPLKITKVYDYVRAVAKTTDLSITEKFFILSDLSQKFQILNDTALEEDLLAAGIGRMVFGEFKLGFNYQTETARDSIITFFTQTARRLVRDTSLTPGEQENMGSMLWEQLKFAQSMSEDVTQAPEFGGKFDAKTFFGMEEAQLQELLKQYYWIPHLKNDFEKFERMYAVQNSIPYVTPDPTSPQWQRYERATVDLFHILAHILHELEERKIDPLAVGQYSLQELYEIRSNLRLPSNPLR